MIDRKLELERLRALADEAPQLIVMRGRRRVGKSYLLDRAFAGRRLVYFQADEGEARGHLDFLAGELRRLVNAPVAFADWNEALETLGEQAVARPLVVVLDEFQWMLAAEPRLDSIVMRQFDRWQRRHLPITLVISGSALSMMEQLVEGDRPMFGRSAYRPLLQPFDYRHASEFATRGLRAAQRLQRYGVLGGTAQYQVWAGRGSLRDILANRILLKDESLFDEPLQLIRGESSIREPGNYFELLRAIAGGATQFNQILHQSKVATGQLLTSRLDRLATLGYLEERRPLLGNGKTSWAVSDPFFRFWFRYVYPNRSRLQLGRVREVCDSILADLDNHMGPVFEDVCRTWCGRYSSDPPLGGASEIGAYWTRTHDVEVDVIARDGQTILAVGSCKWSRRAGRRDLDRLIESRGRISGAGNAALYLFARGFDKRLTERAAGKGVRLLTAEELF